MEGKKPKSKFCWKKPSTVSTERGKDEKHCEETASEPTSSKTETVNCSPLTTNVATCTEESRPTLQSADLHQKLATQRHDDCTNDDDISGDGWSDANDKNPSLGSLAEVTPNLIISTLKKQAKYGPVSHTLPRTPSDWKLPDDYPRISLFPEVMQGIEGCQRIMDSFWEEFYAKSSPHRSPIVSFYSMKSTTGLHKTSSRASRRFHGQQKCTIS